MLIYHTGGGALEDSRVMETPFMNTTVNSVSDVQQFAESPAGVGHRSMTAETLFIGPGFGLPARSEPAFRVSALLSRVLFCLVTAVCVRDFLLLLTSMHRNDVGASPDAGRSMTQSAP